MRQHAASRAIPAPRLALAILLALLGALSAVMAATKAEAAVDRRNVSRATAENGLPKWYQDSKALRVGQCTDEVNCAIEDQAEVVYWAGEASIPIGRRSVDLVMAVEGSFMNPDGTDAEAPSDQTIPLVGSVIQSRGDGLRRNTAYRITHPYGKMTVRTDNRGRFRKLIEHGCDIEPGQTCNPRLALRSPIFDKFLKWDRRVGAKAPAGFLGYPEFPHKVVGSPVRNKAGKPQNYFKIERLRPGRSPLPVGKTAKFSITGQLF